MESTQAAHRAWLEAAGATVDGAGPVEVDASLSYDGEGLEAFAGVAVEAGLVQAEHARGEGGRLANLDTSRDPCAHT